MEKTITLKQNGFFHLFLGILMLFSPLLLILNQEAVVIVATILLSLIGFVWLLGLFIIHPNQTKVIEFFGRYEGTVLSNGFFWLNPFYTKHKVSMRVRNLETDVTKVNDEQGNPILISAIVVWKVTDAYKAIFDIEAAEELDVKSGMRRPQREESYMRFVKIQAESALRKIAHSYPYDNLDETIDEPICLRSGLEVINETLLSEIRERLFLVGIEVIEARISNLSYAPEIAAMMLQRQQAQAIIAARKKIVEGAVGMVDMALKQLEERKITAMSDDAKARMVSNLMVVLCSDSNATPVVTM